MNQMIANLINGNLTDARKQAEKFSQDRIYRCCMEEWEWSESKSHAAAVYLKTGEGWQRFCDAE